MYRLHGSVQHYPWGDKYFLPRWIGTTVDGSPWAELWFGTHANGPTTAIDSPGNKPVPLRDITGDLPFLVKILATSAPLSLQAHPSAEQARAGYDRENKDRVDPVKRNYRDPNAKPEIICAITRFEALCGFRDERDLIGDWVRRGWHDLASDMEHRGMRDFVRAALRGEIKAPKFNLPGWAGEIVKRYPNDPALTVAVCMNHVVLEPGDALFLDACNLHSYLDGAGVEVMGSSDNVIRAGLTEKHVDIDELLRVVNLQGQPKVIRGGDAATTVYEFECDLFDVSCINFADQAIVQAGDKPTIVVASDVKADSIHTGDVLLLQPGEMLRVSGAGSIHVIH